jgi:hypothetical protein
MDESSILYIKSLINNRSVSILAIIRKNMVKYICKSCKTDCDDITEHMIKVHKFSKWIMELQLKTNPNTYKNCFEKKV